MYEEWAWIACVLFALWLSEQSCGCTTWSFGLKRSTPIKKSCCDVLLPPLAKSAYSRETQLLIPLLVPRWPVSIHGLFFLFQQKTGIAAGICCLFNILLHPALSAKAIVAHFFFLSHLPDLTTRLGNHVWMEPVFAVCYIALLTLEQGYSNMSPLNVIFQALLRLYNIGIYFDCQYRLTRVGTKTGGKAFKKCTTTN